MSTEGPYTTELETFRQELLDEQYERHMEAIAGSQHESMMRTDIFYALEQLGTAETVEALLTLTKNLNNLGYSVTINEVVDLIL